MKRTTGFTAIELLAALVLVFLVGTLAIIEKSNLDKGSRDIQRKTAINALYYGLTEGYYKQHKLYPTEVNSKVLPYIDPKSFKDPNDRKLGENQSDYHYKALNCDENGCKGFSLKAKLETESEYRKQVPAVQ